MKRNYETQGFPAGTIAGISRAENSCMTHPLQSLPLGMMRYLRLLSFVLLLLCSNTSLQAQYNMLMLNGRKVSMTEYRITGDDIKYSIESEKRTRHRSADRYDVFSITAPDGKETILYSPIDSLDFSIEEARQFISGEQAGRNYHMRKGRTEALSAAVGIGSGLLGFYSLPVPMIYSVIVGRFNPSQLRVPEGIDPEVRSTEPYRMGYDKGVRNMRIQRAMKWGYIGLGVGLTGLLIYGISQHD